MITAGDPFAKSAKKLCNLTVELVFIVWIHEECVVTPVFLALVSGQGVVGIRRAVKTLNRLATHARM